MYLFYYDKISREGFLERFWLIVTLQIDGGTSSSKTFARIGSYGVAGVVQRRNLPESPAKLARETGPEFAAKAVDIRIN